MIGWQDEAKTLFLGTVLGSGIISLILMLVVLCNIHTSALRKKIFVQELSSLSRGLFFLTLIFALTWSWYPLTYFKLQHLELPDFYPAFQIVNSWMGVFTFVGIGLGSKRFRHAIKSISKRHQKNCIHTNLAYLLPTPYFYLQSALYFNPHSSLFTNIFSVTRILKVSF